MMWEASRVRSFPGETRGAMLPAIMSMIFGFIIIVFLFWALGWALKVFGGWVNDGSTVIGNLIKAALWLLTLGKLNLFKSDGSKGDARQMGVTAGRTIVRGLLGTIKRP